ncbi:Rsp5p-dependent ubiquitination, sorting of cargo proteins at the multivesicular body [Boothiomyces sp. JEL0866]|nr:Rsp5p-dependent ubiquitination, sorting of cargo proteins at the multivesicular body [Boothiomyces sp. JEL0866]
MYQAIKNMSFSTSDNSPINGYYVGDQLLPISTNSASITLFGVPSTSPIIADLSDFIQNLVGSQNGSRSSDDPYIWGNITTMIMYNNPNESFNVSADHNSTFEDTIMISGNLSSSCEHFKSVFSVDLEQVGNEFIGVVNDWNSTLKSGPNSNIDTLFSSKFNSLLRSQLLNYQSLELSGLNGELDGLVGSINEGALYSGRFISQSLKFRHSSVNTSFSFGIGSQILLSNVTRLFVSNQSSSVTYINIEAIGNSKIELSNFRVTKADGTGALSEGTVSFKGCAAYLLYFIIPSYLGYLEILQTVPIFISCGVIFYYICLKLKNKYFTSMKQVDAERDYMEKANYEADRFMAIYPPDSQASILALQTNDTINKNQSGPTMLDLLQFEEFPCVEDLSVVNIGKMRSSGMQTIEFITNVECCIQSNSTLKPRLLNNVEPVPPPSFNESFLLPECYYEVKVLSLVENSKIGIGFASCPYPPFRLPGYDSNSIGYHSHNGSVYLNNRGDGRSCGPAISIGDTLGIGYRLIELPKIGNHILHQTVFYFTHNGIRIGDEHVADGFFPDKIYPTIGATGYAKVEMKFGDVLKVFNSPTTYEFERIVDCESADSNEATADDQSSFKSF